MHTDFPDPVEPLINNTMPQIRPITDLRNTNEISDLYHKQNEPIFITKNGYGDLVVMSIETYECQLALVDKSLQKLNKKYINFPV